MSYLEKVISGINKRKSKEEILKPFPNEHSARVRDPGDFVQRSFRRKNIANGIDIITGWLTGQTTMTTQCYRFKADIYTVSEAKKWLKDHKINYILFEPAKKSLTQTFFENLKI